MRYVGLLRVLLFFLFLLITIEMLPTVIIMMVSFILLMIPSYWNLCGYSLYLSRNVCFVCFKYVSVNLKFGEISLNKTLSSLFIKDEADDSVHYAVVSLTSTTFDGWEVLGCGVTASVRSMHVILSSFPLLKLASAFSQEL